MTDTHPLCSALVLALALFWFGTAAQAQELRLAVPAGMAESGFLKHILPRFKLRYRVAILPVPADAPADLAFASGAEGRRVFAGRDGTPYGLRVLSGNAEATQGADKFLAWLTSAPGRAAIESYPRGGPPLYTAGLPEKTQALAPEITGDAAVGARLALVHCGRCHVVDQRNRMGGIGSTPSFAAMRGRANWFELFGNYWSANPHPSFTEVVGVTEPFGAGRVSHIAPVQITPGEIDAILAFVAGITAKNLGAPLQSN